MKEPDTMTHPRFQNSLRDGSKDSEVVETKIRSEKPGLKMTSVRLEIWLSGWLKAIATLTEGQGLVTSTQHGGSQSSVLSISGDLMPLLAFMGTARVWCIYIHSGKALLHKINIL